MTPDPRYPIGKFAPPSGVVTDTQRAAMIAQVSVLPQRLREAVAGLGEKQLDTPYREGGWTVRQLVHHIADSHMNAYCRFKFALTEDSPTIKPYDENAWVKTVDAKLPIAGSLNVIEGVHEHWTAILRGMSPADFGRQLTHPERGLLTLDFMLALYAWHSQHHVAHITAMRQRGNL